MGAPRSGGFVDVLGHGGSRHGRRGRVPDELIRKGPDEAARDRAGDVDGEQLVKVGLGADGETQELGADLASRVEGGAGDRADQDDDPVDDETDDDPGEAGGRTAIHGGAEDGEHEDRGADDLGQETDAET